jgi:hypothetical protein
MLYLINYRELEVQNIIQDMYIASRRDCIRFVVKLSSKYVATINCMFLYKDKTSFRSLIIEYKDSFKLERLNSRWREPSLKSYPGFLSRSFRGAFCRGITRMCLLLRTIIGIPRCARNDLLPGMQYSVFCVTRDTK